LSTCRPKVGLVNKANIGQFHVAGETCQDT
jgi:hypothetical protein